jgi:hypothetical protein
MLLNPEPSHIPNPQRKTPANPQPDKCNPRLRIHAVWSCAKVASTLVDPSLLLLEYPACAPYANGTNPAQLVPVTLDFGGSDATIGAALGVSFGAALWLAFNIHALGVEVYVSSWRGMWRGGTG